jgi:ubiquinone/menaquinone biosynthesis methyltransferase
MSKNITPYQNSDLSKKEQVAQMFDAISKNYDGLNKVISFGTDAKWKQKILKMVAAKQPKSILDIATGTGDLAILFASTTAEEIIGLDISQGMLDVGKKKIEAQKLTSKIQMVLGDGENIPYPDNYFDNLISIAVIHHLPTKEERIKAISELIRVVKPKGRILIYVWAFEQPPESKRKFTSCDEMVPFQNKDGTIFKRYYHLYVENELETEINQVKAHQFEIVRSFNEMGNWCCVIEKR